MDENKVSFVTSWTFEFFLVPCQQYHSNDFLFFVSSSKKGPADRHMSAPNKIRFAFTFASRPPFKDFSRIQPEEFLLVFLCRPSEFSLLWCDSGNDWVFAASDISPFVIRRTGDVQAHVLTHRFPKAWSPPMQLWPYSTRTAHPVW